MKTQDRKTRGWVNHKLCATKTTQYRSQPSRNAEIPNDPQSEETNKFSLTNRLQPLTSRLAQIKTLRAAESDVKLANRFHGHEFAIDA